MGLQHRSLRLVAYLIAFQLIFGCPANCRQVEESKSSNDSNIIRFIHPTMHRAFLLDDGITLLETNNLALMRSNNVTVWQLSKYLGGYSPDVVSAAKISSSSTNHYPNTRKSSYTPRESAELRQKVVSVLRITYDNEIDTYRRANASLTDDNFGRGSTCNKQAFRAFDLVKILKMNTANFGHNWAVAVGFSDTHLCLFYYESFDPTRVRDDPFGTATQIVEQLLPVPGSLVPKPCYRVASATIADRDASGAQPGIDAIVEYYDEAGQVFRFFIKSPNPSKHTITDFKLIGGLTSVDFIQDLVNTVQEDQKTKRDLGDSKLSVMRQHFEHSFVESIALFEGSLVYSRGLFHNPRVRFINKTDSTWPQGLESSEVSSESTIVALEAYKINETYYYHIFDIQRGTDRKFMKPQVYYWWCTLGTRDLAQKVTWPSKSDSCQYMQHEPARTPIDVVYRAQCNKVYAFYQHLVQSESAVNKFTKGSPYTVLEWMRFPVNAILHDKDRLYLFGPANSLRISDTIGDGCTFEGLSVPEKEYYQSDLILMLAQAVGEQTHPGSPFYDSGRYLELTESGESWQPPLDSDKQIPEHLQLTYEVSSINQEETETSPTMLIVALIAIILVGIAGAYLYFVYFSKARDQPPPADLKSRWPSKKFKRSRGVASEVPDLKANDALSNSPTVRSSHQRVVANEAPDLKANDALSNSPTVRSMHQEPVASATSSKTRADPAMKSPVVRPLEPRGERNRKQSPVGGSSASSGLNRSAREASSSPSRLSKSPSGASRSQGSSQRRPSKTPRSPISQGSPRNGRKAGSS